MVQSCFFFNRTYSSWRTEVLQIPRMSWWLTRSYWPECTAGWVAQDPEHQHSGQRRRTFVAGPVRHLSAPSSVHPLVNSATAVMSLCPQRCQTWVQGRYLALVASLSCPTSSLLQKYRKRIVFRMINDVRYTATTLFPNRRCVHTLDCNSNLLNYKLWCQFHSQRFVLLKFLSVNIFAIVWICHFISTITRNKQWRPFWSTHGDLQNVWSEHKTMKNSEAHRLTY